jgi:hypothetical protein
MMASVSIPGAVALGLSASALVALGLVFGRRRLLGRVNTEQGLGVAVIIVVLALAGNVLVNIVQLDNAARLGALENPTTKELDRRLAVALRRCRQSPPCRRELATLIARAMRDRR